MPLLTMALLLLGTPAAPAGPRPLVLAQAAGPNLEDAVRLKASVDKQEVYLGETVTLTREYWELRFRGVKVQPLYRSPTVGLPDTQGFFAGTVETSYREESLNGVPYSVTTFRQALYPALAGDLQIGVWRWQGTVRGHTAAGARAEPLDISTAPVRVRVKPLPDPPDAFRGAVGEFKMALSFSSRQLKQGVPVTITIELQGTGNVQGLQAPMMPSAPWYSLGEPAELPPEPGNAVKRFRYELMPLQDGVLEFAAVAYTYFSPGEGRYKETTTAPVTLQIEPNGAVDQMVVVGGGSGGAGNRLSAVGEGRLPIVTDLVRFRTRHAVWNLGPFAITLPPLLFIVVVLLTQQGAAKEYWRDRKRHDPPVAEWLARAARHPRPYDALNAAMRGYLAECTGHDVAGLTIPELQACLRDAAGEAPAAAIAGVLQACERSRYGGRKEEIDQLAARARRALEALPRPRRRWRARR